MKDKDTEMLSEAYDKINESGYFWPQSNADKAAARRGRPRPQKPISAESYEEFKQVNDKLIKRIFEIYQEDPNSFPKSYLERIRRLQQIDNPKDFVTGWKRLTGATKWDLPDDLYRWS